MAERRGLRSRAPLKVLCGSFWPFLTVACLLCIMALLTSLLANYYSNKGLLAWRETKARGCCLYLASVVKFEVISAMTQPMIKLRRCSCERSRRCRCLCPVGLSGSALAYRGASHFGDGKRQLNVLCGRVFVGLRRAILWRPAARDATPLLDVSIGGRLWPPQWARHQ